MEKWEQDYISFFTLGGKFKPQTTPHKVNLFIKKLLANERKRNVLIEIIDYVKKSKSNTDILYQYVLNNMTCQTNIVHTYLCYELGIMPGSKEDVILSVLEKYFNPPKETGT